MVRSSHRFPTGPSQIGLLQSKNALQREGRFLEYNSHLNHWHTDARSEKKLCCRFPCIILNENSPDIFFTISLTHACVERFQGRKMFFFSSVCLRCFLYNYNIWAYAGLILLTFKVCKSTQEVQKNCAWSLIFKVCKPKVRPCGFQCSH